MGILEEEFSVEFVVLLVERSAGHKNPYGHRELRLSSVRMRNPMPGQNLADPAQQGRRSSYCMRYCANRSGIVAPGLFFLNSSLANATMDCSRSTKPLGAM